MHKRLSLSLLLFSIFCIPLSSVQAQCLGAQNGGMAFTLDVAVNNCVSFSFLGENFEVCYDNSTGLVEISSNTSSSFHTNGSGVANNLGTGVDVSALSFESGPSTLFNTNTNSGPFGGGTDGFIGVQNSSGEFGWIRLNYCGLTTCSEFLFTVENGGIDNDGGSAITGDCASLGGVLVPTMSEWGLIFFALLILNFGFLAIRQRNLILAGTNKEKFSFKHIPFDRFALVSLTAAVLLTLIAIFSIAILFFGYELTSADVPMGILCSPFVAYAIYLLKNEK